MQARTDRHRLARAQCFARVIEILQRGDRHKTSRAGRRLLLHHATPPRPDPDKAVSVQRLIGHPTLLVFLLVLVLEILHCKQDGAPPSSLRTPCLHVMHLSAQFSPAGVQERGNGIARHERQVQQHHGWFYHGCPSRPTSSLDTHEVHGPVEQSCERSWSVVRDTNQARPSSRSPHPQRVRTLVNKQASASSSTSTLLHLDSTQRQGRSREFSEAAAPSHPCTFVARQDDGGRAEQTRSACRHPRLYWQDIHRRGASS